MKGMFQATHLDHLPILAGECGDLAIVNAEHVAVKLAPAPAKVEKDCTRVSCLAGTSTTEKRDDSLSTAWRSRRHPLGIVVVNASRNRTVSYMPPTVLRMHAETCIQVHGHTQGLAIYTHHLHTAWVPHRSLFSDHRCPAKSAQSTLAPY